MKRCIIFLIVLLTLAFSINVNATGLSPPRFEIDFAPNFEGTFEIIIINTASYPINASLSFIGPYSKYFSLPEKEYYFIDPGGSQVAKFKVKLPSIPDKPGNLQTGIRARGVPTGSSQINLVSSVESQFIVKVPYPGKYAEIDFKPGNINHGEIAKFNVLLANLGKETIARAKISIFINDVLGNNLETLKTTLLNIISKTTREAILEFNASLISPGSYKLEAIAEYDGILSNKIESDFRIGQLYINITNYTNKFEADKINKFDIEVQNLWNNRVDEIYGEIKFVKDDVRIGDLIKTLTTSIEAWESKTISSYWDTNELDHGIYDAEITLYYENKTTAILVPVNIEEKKVIEATTAIASLLILVIIFNLIWYIYHRIKSHRILEARYKIQSQNQSNQNQNQNRNQNQNKDQENRDDLW